jgi:hypothetical protein
LNQPALSTPSPSQSPVTSTPSLDRTPGGASCAAAAGVTVTDSAAVATTVAAVRNREIFNFSPSDLVPDKRAGK